MNNIVQLLMVMALFVAWGATAQAGDLTLEQEAAVIAAIDDVCGDTWCEGQYEYKFNSMVCDFNAGTCEFGYEYWDEDMVSVPSSCTLTEVFSYSDMMTMKYGGYEDLSEAFYDKVNDCIGGYTH